LRRRASLLKARSQSPVCGSCVRPASNDAFPSQPTSVPWDHICCGWKCCGENSIYPVPATWLTRLTASGTTWRVSSRILCCSPTIACAWNERATTYWMIGAPLIFSSRPSALKFRFVTGCPLIALKTFCCLFFSPSLFSSWPFRTFSLDRLLRTKTDVQVLRDTFSDDEKRCSGCARQARQMRVRAQTRNASVSD
jgi:hypothetical protein